MPADCIIRTMHHLIPRARGGDDSPFNQVMIAMRHHMAWHTLLGIPMPEESLQRLLMYWVPAKTFDFVSVQHGRLTTEIELPATDQYFRSPPHALVAKGHADQVDQIKAFELLFGGWPPAEMLQLVLDHWTPLHYVSRLTFRQQGREVRLKPRREYGKVVSLHLRRTDVTLGWRSTRPMDAIQLRRHLRALWDPQLVAS